MKALLYVIGAAVALVVAVGIYGASLTSDPNSKRSKLNALEHECGRMREIATTSSEKLRVRDFCEAAERDIRAAHK